MRKVIVHKEPAVGRTETGMTLGMLNALSMELSRPTVPEIRAAETTPKVLKPKFQVWATAVALNLPCPPILVCRSRNGRVTVQGVNV